MRDSFHRLSARWFAIMTPASAPASNIYERETLRKRRLLSVILLILFLWITPLIPLAIIGRADITEVGLNLLASGVIAIALWLNRRGYLKSAGLFFLLVESFSMAISSINLAAVMPISILYIWMPLLIFPITAGLLLPFWGPLLLALLDVLFLIWFTSVEYAQIIALARDRGAPSVFLGFSCMIIIIITLLSALYTVTTNKAVIQADRTIEVELAHQALSIAHGELEQAHARIQKQALTDPLTELSNHRAVLDQLEKEMNRAQRFGRSVSLLFFDLDHFKALNDGYGHAAGDEALCAFSQLLRRHMRSIDTVGRWGGEEFLAILPETSSPEAQAIAERMRGALSQQVFAIAGGLHLTCSIGIACYPTQVATQEALINAADQAMYAAKRLGRNQVRVIDEAVVKVVLADEEGEGDRETTALHGFIEALTSLVEQRDSALGKHSSNVADLVHQVALNIGIPVREAQMMSLAGQLHDIGKIGVPDAILQKPAHLTEEEWGQMKRHSAMGAEVVARIPALRPLSSLIRAHHERWDGTGYPDQLKAEAIPLGARVIAVVDAYCAMLADRPYQRARSSEDALAELRCCAGGQFDPRVVEALAVLLQQQIDRQQVVHAA